MFPQKSTITKLTTLLVITTTILQIQCRSDLKLASRNLVTTAAPITSTTTPPPELPEFSEPIGNQTVALGRDAQLACKINKLGHFRTAWLRVEDKGILTIHNNVITRNYRFGLINDNDGSNFLLTIKNVQPSDRGGYMCQINSVPMKFAIGYLDVLTPPVFSDEENNATTSPLLEGATTPLPVGPITVAEGGNVSLSCRASGHPAPLITWRREDNEPIQLANLNSQQQNFVSKFEGPSIQLTGVTKSNSGAYLCIASNGVQPAASKRQLLDVQYPPIVRLPEKEVGIQLGQQSVRLSCFVEANPMGSLHWVKLANEEGNERTDEMSLLERDELVNSDKYEIVMKHISSEKVEMVLNLRNLERHDLAWYRCIARNQLGLQSSSIRLSESSFSLDEMLNRALGGSGNSVSGELNDQSATTGSGELTTATGSGRPAGRVGSSRAHTRSSWIQRPAGSRQEQQSSSSSRALLGSSGNSEPASRSTGSARATGSWSLQLLGLLALVCFTSPFKLSSYLSPRSSFSFSL